jgi:DNA-binding NarL/FixJ family response regulator
MAKKGDNGRLRVVIADDHKLFAELLRSSLCTDDRVDVVGLAFTGTEAVDLVQEFEPDVVLMDLNMPVMDGVEAIRRLRESGCLTRVLVLTSSDSQDDAVRAMEAGAAGFVRKDQSVGDLMETFLEVASLSVAFGGAAPPA